MFFKRFSLIAIAALALSGCIIVPAKLDPLAFGSGKTYAIVTIASQEKVLPGSRSFTEMVTGKDSRTGAQVVLKATKPAILQVFAKSPHFKLMPERTVLSHRAYKAVEADPASFFGVDFIVPKGYKFFKTDEKFAELAKGLGVDGVIFIGVTYDGYIKGGQALGQVSFQATAIDRNGTKVWKEAVFTKSDRSISHSGGDVDYAKFHPLLVDATGKAAAAIINKLDEKITGGISGFNWDPERLR